MYMVTSASDLGVTIMSINNYYYDNDNNCTLVNHRPT